MRSPSFTVCLVRMLILAILALFLGSSTGAHAQEKKPEAKNPVKITYDEHIKPIFRAKCFTCHNANKKSGDLDLTNFTNVMLGGGSGEVIDRGSSEDSYLFSLLSHESEPFMPPKSEKLPKETLALIAKWINGGALESSGSKRFVSNKPKFDFTLKSDPTSKPAVPPMPGRLSLEPIIVTKQKTAVPTLATSPWAPLIAVGGQKQVLLYHTQSLEPLGILPFPEGVPNVLKFSRNGSLLLAGGGRGAFQGRVVVWDVKTGRRVLEIGDELDAVLGADLSADHSLIALGGPNKIVRIYSTQDGKLLHEISKHTNWITSIEFSPDGVLLATGDRNGGLFVWESHTAREYLSLRGHSKTITGLSWRSDSNLLASGSEDTTVRLWEMENGRQVKSWGAHGGGTASVEFTRDGRLVSCGRDRLTKLWDQNGKQLRAFGAFADIALRVTHCDETNRVIAGDWSGTIRVWNSADGKQVSELNSNPQKLAVRLELATKLLASRQAEHQKLTAASGASQKVAEKAKADFAAAQKALTESQKQLQTAQNTVKQTQLSITQLTTRNQAAAKTATTLQPLLAPLKESVAKAQQAAAKVPTDKELAAAVALLKTQRDKKTAAHATAVKTVAETKVALEKDKQKLAATEKQVRDFTTLFTAAQKKLAAVTPTVKPAVDKAAADKKAAAVATAALAEAGKSVDRWKDEINLLSKLDELALREGKHDELLIAYEQTQIAVETVQAELKTTNQAAAEAQKKSAAASAAVDAAKKTLAQLSAVQATAVKSVETLKAVLPILKAAAAKGKEASDKLKGDKDIAAAAAQLKAVLDKKTAELTATEKSVAPKTAAVENAKKTVASQQKQASEAASALEKIRKSIVEISTRLKQAEQKAATAKSTAAAAQKEIDALRAVL